MNPHHFEDTESFPLAPPSGHHFLYFNTLSRQDIVKSDYLISTLKSALGPQRMNPHELDGLIASPLVLPSTPEGFLLHLPVWAYGEGLNTSTTFITYSSTNLINKYLNAPAEGLSPKPNRSNQHLSLTVAPETFYRSVRILYVRISETSQARTL